MHLWKKNEEAFFVVIWKYIQDILLMEKSKEQKNMYATT